MTPAESPLIALVAASLDEAEPLRGAIEALETLGVPHEVRIASQWAAPRELLDWAGMAEARGIRAIIAAAGAEPGLASALAAACRLPVIAVPVADDRADADAAAALASNRGSLAPALIVPAGGARQAAVAAVRILAVADRRWRGPLEEQRRTAAADLERDNATARSQWSGDSARAREQSLHELFPKHAHPSPEPAPVYDLTSAAAAPAKPAKSASDENEAKIRKAEELYRPLAGKPAAAAPLPAQGEEEPAAPARPAPPARKLGRIAIDADSPDVAAIEEVVDCLLEGGVIAFPTETVYGLAADATNAAAVEKLFSLKGRERTKAISLMVDSGKLLGAIAQNVTVEVRRLMEAFWPGPLTLVLQKRPGNFKHVSAEETIGVRLPDHSVPLAIMQSLARPLACTSANLSGAPEARSADEIEALFGDRLDALLDGGPLAQRPASTVLDVSRDPFRVLRQGAITREQIGAVVGEKLEGEE